MAEIYKAICKNCLSEKRILWGDGMYYIQYQCSHCLKTVDIPRYAPRQNREGREVPKFLEKINFHSYPPTPSDEIIRFTDAELNDYLINHVSWQIGDDKWDEFEIQIILQILGCACSSVFERVGRDSSPSTRCDLCISVDFQMNLDQLAD